MTLKITNKEDYILVEPFNGNGLLGNSGGSSGTFLNA